MHTKLSVCMGPKCRAHNSREILETVDNYLRERKCPYINLDDSIDLGVNLCNQYCDDGPLVIMGDQIFLHMDTDKALGLINAYYKHDFDFIKSLDPKGFDKTHGNRNR